VHVPIAVVRSFSGGVTKSQKKGAILGVFYPIQNHWQSSRQPLLQHHGRLRYKRNHSIANNVKPQTGSLNMPGKRK